MRAWRLCLRLRDGRVDCTFLGGGGDSGRDRGVSCGEVEARGVFGSSGGEGKDGERMTGEQGVACSGCAQGKAGCVSEVLSSQSSCGGVSSLLRW